jgi:hypothetical protein
MKGFVRYIQKPLANQVLLRINIFKIGNYPTRLDAVSHPVYLSNFRETVFETNGKVNLRLYVKQAYCGRTRLKIQISLQDY